MSSKEPGFPHVQIRDESFEDLDLHVEMLVFVHTGQQSVGHPVTGYYYFLMGVITGQLAP